MNRSILEIYSWNQGTAAKTVVWDTCKAYVRGLIIAFKAYREKKVV